MGIDNKLYPPNLAFWGMESRKITVEEQPLQLMSECENQRFPWSMIVMAAVLGLCLGLAIVVQ